MVVNCKVMWAFFFKNKMNTLTLENNPLIRRSSFRRESNEEGDRARRLSSSLLAKKSEGGSRFSLLKKNVLQAVAAKAGANSKYS